MTRRACYPCYTDIRLSIRAATRAIVLCKLGLRLWASEDSPAASLLSSLRIHLLLSVISAGQTTRLKLALCHVSLHALCSSQRDEYLGNDASWSQSNRHRHPAFRLSGRFSQSLLELTPTSFCPKTDWSTPYCLAHPSADVVLPPGTWEGSAL